MEADRRLIALLLLTVDYIRRDVIRLLSARSIGLVHLVLDEAHAFGLLNPKLLPFLVPAPLVDLAFTEARLATDRLQGLLGPVGVLVEEPI